MVRYEVDPVCSGFLTLGKLHLLFSDWFLQCLNYNHLFFLFLFVRLICGLLHVSFVIKILVLSHMNLYCIMDQVNRYFEVYLVHWIFFQTVFRKV